MVYLKDLVEFLNKEIVIDSIKDKCLNGLVIEGKQTIQRVGIAVDISLNVIKKAVEANCDIIVAHHALLWEPVQKLTGLLAKKIEMLMKNSISIYTAHLPLDIHKKYSHGKLLAGNLGIYGVTKFGKNDTNYFGFSGHFRRKVSLENLKEMIDKTLLTDSRVFAYGKKEIGSIAIISGVGGFAVEEAVDMDCFLTGEMSHSSLLAAKDLKINVILAGHYETERAGMVKLSQSITKKFKTPCLFLES